MARSGRFQALGLMSDSYTFTQGCSIYFSLWYLLSDFSEGLVDMQDFGESLSSLFF